jgi:hypothetical protein
MSLISDALKKARQEAARQDALRQRAPYAVGTADSPDRRPALLPLLAGVGAGCLVAALLLVLAWSAGWGPFNEPAARAAQVAEAAPAAPPASAAPAAGPFQAPIIEEPEATPPVSSQSTTPAPSAAAPVQETRPQPSIELRPAAPAEPSTIRPAPAPPAPIEERPAPVPSAPSPSAPARPAAAGDLVDGTVYSGEVPVPGGGTLKLNGIAYSQDRPVAVLDGRVMGPGEVIQGFTIVAIETGRVKLQGHGATVFVSPK